MKTKTNEYVPSPEIMEIVAKHPAMKKEVRKHKRMVRLSHMHSHIILEDKFKPEEKILTSNRIQQRMHDMIVEGIETE